MADHYVCGFRSTPQKEEAVKEYLARRFRISKERVVFKPCEYDNTLTEVFLEDIPVDEGEGNRLHGFLEGMGFGPKASI